MYPFLLYQLQSKANAVNQTILLWMTVDQLSIQAATAENEEQYI